jgi:hypothetical protein
LAVLDAAGRPVPFQILNNSGSALTIQVTQIVRGGAYFVRVSNPAGADATGRYHLTADFQAPVDVKYSRLAAGQLTPAAPTATTTLTVNAARLFEFALVSSAGDSAATGGATLTVRDSSGKVVLTLTQEKGGTTNGAVYLAPGTYTVEIGAPARKTNYWAGVRVASGPVGPYDSGTSTTYPGSPPPPDGTSGGGSMPPPSSPPPGSPPPPDGTYTTSGSNPPPPESPPQYPPPPPPSDGSSGTTTQAPPPYTPPGDGYGGYYTF